MFDIKKQFMWSKLKVGAVVTVAILLVLLTVFFAGSIESMFSPKIEIKAQIKDIRGLRKGAPVWVSGIEIGFVKRISLDPEHGTLVTMSIKKKSLQYIGRDSTATVMTLGLLGDKYVELSGGSTEAGAISPGDVIKGRAQLEVKDLVDASSESLAKVTDFISKIGSFVEKIEKSEGTAVKLLTDPSLYNDLKDAASSLSKVLDDFKHSQGTVKMLIDDPSLYNKLLSASSSMEEFSKKINEGKGTLKKLAEDPSLYDNLDKASKQLGSVLDDIESGKGTVGTLIKDKELAGDLKETISGLREAVDELKDLTADIKANPKRYFKFSLF